MKNQVLTNWETENQRMKKILDEITDEQLERQVAPGKNTGVYLLGHLITANDYMMHLLGLGERQHAALDEAFIRNPDGNSHARPSTAELREMWTAQHAHLTPLLNTITSDGWLERHTAVSEADFAAQPNRNKLNVLITRTMHQSYHFGQLMLLK